MTLIILVNDTDAAHLDEVKADMAHLGAPTIRAIDAGDHLIAIEGSHRLRAAQELGVAVNIQTINDDETVDLDTLDWDDNGWFDERIVSTADFIERFTSQPFPAGAATAEIEVA